MSLNDNKHWTYGYNFMHKSHFCGQASIGHFSYMSAHAHTLDYIRVKYAAMYVYHRKHGQS